MNRTRHNRIAAEQGSILMETILVIPLFIAFFSGIFVLGDLMLGRNRLTAADRFAVWLAGCRFADTGDDEVRSTASEGFFGSGEFAEGTQLRSFKSRKERVNWYSLVRGTGELKITLPVWAAGLLVRASELRHDAQPHLESRREQIAAFDRTIEKFNGGVRDFSEVDYNLRGSVERMDLAVRDLSSAMREINRRMEGEGT